jgi:hypothetical protein
MNTITHKINEMMRKIMNKIMHKNDETAYK